MELSAIHRFVFRWIPAVTALPSSTLQVSSAARKVRRVDGAQCNPPIRIVVDSGGNGSASIHPTGFPVHPTGTALARANERHLGVKVRRRDAVSH